MKSDAIECPSCNAAIWVAARGPLPAEGRLSRDFLAINANASARSKLKPDEVGWKIAGVMRDGELLAVPDPVAPWVLRAHRSTCAALAGEAPLHPAIGALVAAGWSFVKIARALDMAWGDLRPRVTVKHRPADPATVARLEALLAGEKAGQGEELLAEGPADGLGSAAHEGGHMGMDEAPPTGQRLWQPDLFTGREALVPRPERCATCAGLLGDGAEHRASFVEFTRAVEAEVLPRVQWAVAERTRRGPRPDAPPAGVPDPRRLWLRPAEVATAYGVSRKTVYGWIHERRVRVKKLGKKRGAPVLVSRADVDRLR